MIYLLDFDGVIFNTEALKEKMRLYGLEESLRAADLFNKLMDAEPGFTLSSLVFPDAGAFLKMHAQDCRIVSSFMSSDPRNNTNDTLSFTYQQAKIRLSGVEEIVGKNNVHIVGATKAEALSQLQETCAQEGLSCMFIDDRKEFVEEAVKLGITGVWMNRKGEEETPSSLPTVDSFAGIEEKIEIWKT